MDPISIALGLAQFVPGITRLLMGDKAGKVAEEVVGTAKRITGTDSAEEAANKIHVDPEMQFKLQKEMNHLVITELEAENKQLESINQTMRIEAQSNDPFVRRWRPFFGYTVAVTWFILMFALGVVIVSEPGEASAVINAMINLNTMWAIALAVLGVSINKRSQDKMVATGQRPDPGILGSIAQRILSKKAEQK